MLIGLKGHYKSGKDETFKIIQELYPDVQRVSFAERLKTSAANSLNMSRELMEELKQHENLHIKIAGTSAIHSLLSSDCAGEATKWSITMREFLQFYGTEGHRNVFGTDFWVDQALPLDTDHSSSFIVVTDMRFSNEIERVKSLGGWCVKVERNHIESRFSNHSSEQDLDHLMDLFLDNTRSKDDLRVNIKEMLRNIGLAEGTGQMIKERVNG